MRAEQGFKHIILVRSHALSQMRRLDQSHIAISQKNRCSQVILLFLFWSSKSDNTLFLLAQVPKVPYKKISRCTDDPSLSKRFAHSAGGVMPLWPASSVVRDGLNRQPQICVYDSILG